MPHQTAFLLFWHMPLLLQIEPKPFFLQHPIPSQLIDSLEASSQAGDSSILAAYSIAMDPKGQEGANRLDADNRVELNVPKSYAKDRILLAYLQFMVENVLLILLLQAAYSCHKFLA